MGNFNFFKVCATFLFFFYSFCSHSNDGLNLTQRLEIEKAFPLQGIYAETLDDLRSKHVLFVGGFMNCWAAVPKMADYFRASIDTVQKDLEIDTSYYGPSSSLSIPENSDFIYNEIIETYARVRKPIILVGHSKGGAEILYTLLKYPELILNSIVDRAVLLQAAIGGSEMASRTNRNLSVWLFSRFFGKGLDSLDPIVSSRNFRKVFKRFKKSMARIYRGESKEFILQKRREISNRIFYIRGAQTHLSFGLRIVRWINGKTPGDTESDGLLPIASQVLDSSLTDSEPFGTDLGIVQLDHMEGYISGPMSNSTEDDRKALMRAILQQIYE